MAQITEEIDVDSAAYKQRVKTEVAQDKQAHDLTKKAKSTSTSTSKAQVSRDDTAAPPGPGLLSLLVLATMIGFFMSRMVTQTWFWGYEGKYVDPHTYLDLIRPPSLLTLTPYQLSLHTGDDPTLPVYIAIDGDVYDTSSSTSYAPGGSYHFFAGVDAARAYGTGCFRKEMGHLTHDLRGLSEAEMKGVIHWKEFYKGHAKYKKVGVVQHSPIDPNSPIPPPCK